MRTDGVMPWPFCASRLFDDEFVVAARGQVDVEARLARSRRGEAPQSSVM
jgi:hypothetical protein